MRTKRGRALAGAFSAEGEDLIAAARRAGRAPVEGYRLTGTDIGGRRFLDVDAPALAAVSTLGSGTRAIGVYEQRWLAAPAGPLCMYLHGVRDPGNVGTVLRGAHAFEASCVALGPGCADPHSPKAVRASMGAIFAVALARARDLSGLPGVLVALAANEGEPLQDVLREIGGREAPTGRREAPPGSGEGAGPGAVPALTLLVGAEREGLPEEVVHACAHVAHIPIAAESLNAAMAATVALYETRRVGTRSSRVRPS